jgi:hypothetical protein
MVLVTGPADVISKTKDILKRIDVGPNRVVPGTPILKQY